MWKLLLSAFIALLLLIGWRSQELGQPAPEFALEDVYGRTVRLQSLKGGPVLLVFWSTSCGICRTQMPILENLRSEYRGKGLQVLGISLDDRRSASSYLTANHYYMNSVVDPSGETAQRYGVSGIPAMVLVDREGRIAGRATGYRSEPRLRAALRRVGL